MTDTPASLTIQSWLIKEYGFDKAAVLEYFIYLNRIAMNGKRNESNGRCWFYLRKEVWEKELFFCNKRTMEKYISFFKEKGLLFTRQTKTLDRSNYYSLVLEVLYNSDYYKSTIYLPSVDASTQNGGMVPDKDNSEETDEKPNEIPSTQTAGMEARNLGASLYNNNNKDIDLNPPIVPQGDKPKRKSRTSIGFTEDGIKLWEAYSKAYFKRYKTDPIADTKEKKDANAIAKKVPIGEAIRIAEFYLMLESQWYVTQTHDIRWLNTQFNSVRSQMISGKKITQSYAKKVDATSERRNQYERLAEEFRKKDNEKYGELT